MAAHCFIDGNVFLYRRDRRDTGKQRRAAEWIEALWRDEAGHISWQVLLEFLANIRRIDPAASIERARQEVDRLLQWHPVPTNETLIQRACAIEDRYQLNWWDALIVAAAQLAGCRYLLSEDLQDGQRFGRVTVVDPFAHDVAAVLG